MDPTTSTDHGNTRLLLAPGVLIALGAFLTLLGIGAFMASGAIEHVPQGTAQTQLWMEGAPLLLILTGYISIPGNIALIIGALMLAHLAGWTPSRRHELHRIDLPGVWATLVIATLLILLYDLALPRGLVTLAGGDPVVFKAFYETFDLIHSVGLVVFYLATTALFAHQTKTASTPRATWGWRIATGVSVLAVILSLGLVIRSPPAFLVPSVFITWSAILWIGIRMARGTPTSTETVTQKIQPAQGGRPGRRPQ